MKSYALLKLALMMSLHGLVRSKEIRLLALSLTLAVTALTSVSWLIERVNSALTQQSNHMLAADALLSYSRPIRPLLYPDTTALNTATQILFPSMVSTEFATVLASIKAVSSHHPLRGELLSIDQQVIPAPARGQIYIDPRLAEQLQVQKGDTLQVGELNTVIADILLREPDTSFNLSALQPRLLMHVDDLPATQLLGVGSRAQYRLGVAGEYAALQQWISQIKPQLAIGERLEDVREARPELNTALTRAEQFLKLIASLTAVLCGLAVFLTAQRFTERSRHSVALFRTLGIQRQQLRYLFSYQLISLWLIAVAAGGSLAWGAQAILFNLLQDRLPDNLPTLSIYPLLYCAGMSGILLLGSSLPKLWQLATTSPMHILRALPLNRHATLWHTLFFIVAALAIIVWQVQSLHLVSILVGGLIATCISCALLIRLFIVLSQHNALWLTVQLRARPLLYTIQLTALCFGLLGMWLITVVEKDLLGAWEANLPSDTPNQFLINIQPNQISALNALFKKHDQSLPALYANIRGRIVSHNQQPIIINNLTDPRAQRLATREFNLSVEDTPHPDNRIIAGQALNPSQPGFSVEEGIAKTFNWHLGDTLSFDIAGQRIQAPIVNLRAVNWDSFQVNFFVIASADLLKDQPTSYMSSFYLPDHQRALVLAMVQQFPNISVFDVGAILAEVRQILHLSTQALRVVFIFCILAGLLVLLAALGTTQAARIKETAILRTMGVSLRVLQRYWIGEALLLGALAGGLAGIIASGSGWYVGRYILELHTTPNWLLPLWALLSGALLTCLTLWMSLQRMSRVSPLQLLNPR